MCDRAPNGQVSRRCQQSKKKGDVPAGLRTPTMLIRQQRARAALPRQTTPTASDGVIGRRHFTLLRSVSITLETERNHAKGCWPRHLPAEDRCLRP